jgi:N utilization substance protein B
MAIPALAPAARRKARHYAMQALYQWQMSKLDPWEITQQFREEYDMAHVDVDYFEELVQSIPRQLDAIDGGFEPFLQGRSLNELDPITVALLRIASYELIRRIDVPYKVVINEAVSLAKKFGATDAHKFINGVLDKAAAKHRSLEAKGNQ